MVAKFFFRETKRIYASMICLHVVNALFHNGFSNTYLSRYSSVSLNRSLSQPWHDPHGYYGVNYQRHYHRARSLAINASSRTQYWAINASTRAQSWAINASTRSRSWAINSSTRTRSRKLSMSQLGHDLKLSMSQLGDDLVNHQWLN